MNNPYVSPAQSRRGVPGKIIAVIVAGVLSVCCVLPGVVLLATGVFDAAMSEPPSAEVVACRVDGRSAEVEWAVTNHGSVDRRFTVRVVVKDSEGRQVGERTRWSVAVDAGAAVRDSTWLILEVDAGGGETCHVSVE